MRPSVAVSKISLFLEGGEGGAAGGDGGRWLEKGGEKANVRVLSYESVWVRSYVNERKQQLRYYGWMNWRGWQGGGFFFR